ncbi:MAG: AMP-binding protein [Candidatus Dormibacteraeota bacterium]|nr:AMP-binding protein [Candidatus Dormibacteraeota bacterium]MBO0762637.1 AMP-binding protein [Candidatus Dormibacteraeota bacterium]
MSDLLRVSSYQDALDRFSWDGLWALFDGSRDWLNIAFECVDRHEAEATAARILRPDGGVDELSFGALSTASAQFAHALERRGVDRGAAVGILLEPSPEFYTALFGTLKRGAVAVPLYTLFGPDAVRERLDDCEAALLVVDEAGEGVAARLETPHLTFGAQLWNELGSLPGTYTCATAAADAAVLQYTSGTTRQLPEAVPHDHRAVVTLARAALFALGLKPGDRYLCPSSPAWGHGLWHGTIAPLSLGIGVGAYAGRFSVDRLLDGAAQLAATNLAAASTVYRMILASGRARELRGLQKASYTGEDLDAAAQGEFQETVGIPICGMYGTTETGVVLANYPGFSGYAPRPGALGKPVPGCDVAVLGPDGSVLAPGAVGELAVWRRSAWVRARDLGSQDEDGYFRYAGRADDVIISGGWTISPLEVERALLRHPAVHDAAVVGVPDDLRGHVVKAFVIADHGDPALALELQDLVRDTLGRHEYPRQVEFVAQLPRTANGKKDRRALRSRSAGQETMEGDTAPWRAPG